MVAEFRETLRECDLVDLRFVGYIHLLGQIEDLVSN